jgi:hypothetical protein
MSQQNTLLFQLQELKQKINSEKNNYNEAIRSGKEFKVAKQILLKITLLKKEADKIDRHLSKVPC